MIASDFYHIRDRDKERKRWRKRKKFPCEIRVTIRAIRAALPQEWCHLKHAIDIYES